MQASPTIVRRRRERWFYLSMTVVFVLTVFAGFAPTYYLRPAFNSTPLPALLHLHGLIFTSWLVLFAIQTTLVAAHRTDIHRRLGVAGAVNAALMIINRRGDRSHSGEAGRDATTGYITAFFSGYPTRRHLCLWSSGRGRILFPTKARRAQAFDDAGDDFYFAGSCGTVALRCHANWASGIFWIQ